MVMAVMAQSDTSASVAGAEKDIVAQLEELHCVRCHKNFSAGDDSAKCIIEHSYDNFHGSFHGTSWYKGTLGCCGAHYRYHRHNSDEEHAEPKYCYRGRHTTDPSKVRYNKSSVLICSKERCGEALCILAKDAYDKREQAAKAARKAKVEARTKEKSMKIHITTPKGNDDQKQEARKRRAKMLGLDVDDEGLEDPEGRNDDESDSSIVPPWVTDMLGKD